jgi:hypothetical protein
MDMAKEFVMSNFGKAGLFTTVGFLAFVGVAVPGSIAAELLTPEQIVSGFQKIDRDANGQISLDEYKLSMEGVVAKSDQMGATLPVYINGYEMHYPRDRIIYLSGGQVVVDPGPSRFYQ